MAKINFGGTIEEVVTREEYPLSQAVEYLKNDTIAIIGYGVQGPGFTFNLLKKNQSVIHLLFFINCTLECEEFHNNIVESIVLSNILQHKATKPPPCKCNY